VRRFAHICRAIALSALAATTHTVLSAGAIRTSPYTYLHHPVSTDIPAAQFAFDRGLTMVIAYQQDEGERAFREAARLDPSLDAMLYGEPPIWFYPVRESLGAALLKQGDAAGGVSTFREGLRFAPHDPRMLFGLSAAETATGDTTGADAARKEFERLWQGAQGEPRIADF